MRNKLQEVCENQRPFVVFQKPNCRDWQVWFCCSDEVRSLERWQESSGFLMYSFDGKRQVFFEEKECEVYTIPAEEPLSYTTKKTLKNTFDEAEQKSYLALLNKTIQDIQQSSLEKVVFSRKETVEIDAQLLYEYFSQMTQKYPTAYVYWWFHPKVGMWMGATPEQFLRVENKQLQTVALAGTQLVTNQSKEEVIWGTKERDEQAVVAQYISEILGKYTQNIQQSEVYTHQAGTLFHLKTDFQAFLPTDEVLEHIIKDLHPTPALCGSPKSLAFEYILANEGYSREFYGGFLGEYRVGAEHNTNLFVNLRCMQIFKDKVNLYLGGGINKDSIATDELQETVNKSATMKQILYK